MHNDVSYSIYRTNTVTDEYIQSALITCYVAFPGSCTHDPDAASMFSQTKTFGVSNAFSYHYSESYNCILSVC